MRREALLTRAECNMLRGIAIIGIFLHNYSHWLNPIVKENEYTFSQHNVDWLHQVLASPDGLLPLHLLSFFGHYGVPVFLFLSAFGLVRKYEQPQGPATAGAKVAGGPSVWAFMRYHYLKLFKMMIVGFVAFTMVDAVTPQRWHYTPLQIVAQLGMFNNLLPDPDHQIWPGPYWFFGLMLQLYAVYRLFLYKRHWGVTVALMVACTGVQLLFGAESAELNRWRYNFMGGMLPFGLGLLYGRYGERIIPLAGLKRWHHALLAIAMAVLVFLFSEGFFLWTLAPAFVCVASIYLVRALPMGLGRWLEWMGGISAALFVIHPLVRKVFIPISRGGDIYAGFLLYVVSAIALAWIVREVMKKIPNPSMK